MSKRLSDDVMAFLFTMKPFKIVFDMLRCGRNSFGLARGFGVRRLDAAFLIDAKAPSTAPHA
jgi:hypothetical protein